MHSYVKVCSRILRFTAIGLALLVCSAITLNLLGCLTTAGSAQDVPPAGGSGVTGQSPAVVQTSPSITTAVHHDLSLPLLLLQPAPPKLSHEVHSVMPLPLTSTVVAPDPVVQSTDLRVLAPVPNMSFSGVGEGFVGPTGTYVISAAPPDTDGAVGPNHCGQSHLHPVRRRGRALTDRISPESRNLREVGALLGRARQASPLQSCSPASSRSGQSSKFPALSTTSSV